MRGESLFLTERQGSFNKGTASNGRRIQLLIVLLLAACCPDDALAYVEGAQPAYEGTSPGSIAGTAQDSQSIIQCSQTVNALHGLTSNLTFPDHLASKDAVRASGDFDVNRYFSVLDHLSMQPGYILDYVYFFEGIGGEPIIYARKADVPAYRTYSEYLSDRGVASPFDDRKSYLDHVVIDGTPEGYFQYALLYLMGGQFYLYWHANYNDQKVVCDISEARRIIESLRGEGSEPIYPEMLSNFSQKDFSPIVQLRGDEAKVRLVVFTEWGGFIQKNITIRREKPHSLLNETSNVIMPYNCGINF